jgi:hypothetical protein
MAECASLQRVNNTTDLHNECVDRKKGGQINPTRISSKCEVVFAEMLCMVHVDELDDHHDLSLGALMVYVTTAE